MAVWSRSLEKPTATLEEGGVVQWRHRNLPRSRGPCKTPQREQRLWSRASLQGQPGRKEPRGRHEGSQPEHSQGGVSPSPRDCPLLVSPRSDILTVRPSGVSTHLAFPPASVDVAPDHLCYLFRICVGSPISVATTCTRYRLSASRSSCATLKISPVAGSILSQPLLSPLRE